MLSGRGDCTRGKRRAKKSRMNAWKRGLSEGEIELCACCKIERNCERMLSEMTEVGLEK